ncbi:sugar phosphate isomerase/epimerase family protein [Paenibacillus sp. GYB003]|uniref:sugar phosphate isomerase/epimerase family protein n=1 Tax=Paenibacillus sp. GYB003 TaxID=2994392 RepID=UPI002F9641B2
MPHSIGVRLTKGIAMANERGDWREWFGWMAEAGFRVVDVPELNAETKRDAEEAGLAIGTFDVGHVQVARLFSKNEETRYAAREHVRAGIAGAAALGGKLCFMCLKPEDPSTTRHESFELFKEMFPALLADAERAGVAVVLEGWPGNAPYYPTIGCTPEMLRAMFEAVPSPALQLNYDPSHLIRLGIDPIRFLREFADRIKHVHAKDCVVLPENVYLYGRHQPPVFGNGIKSSEGPWRYAIPGEGQADWAAIAFELDLAGYDGAVTVELEDHRYKGSVAEHRRGLQKSLAHLSRFFS